MSEKRMLILDAELVKRMDDNRGDLSRSDFVTFLIDSLMQEKGKGENNNLVTRDEFHQFQEGMRELLRNFLEFFISYGLELGKQPKDEEFDRLVQQLQALGSSYKSKKS